jgi:hypothetical protein
VPAPYVPFDPMVFFAPNGRLEWVSSTDPAAFGALVRPTDSVYFLVGRRDLMFDVTAKSADSDIVFQNVSPIPTLGVSSPPPVTENFWVAVGYQTGLVTTSPMAQTFQDYTGATAGMTGGIPGMGATWYDVVDLTMRGYGSYPGPRAYARDAQYAGTR